MSMVPRLERIASSVTLAIDAKAKELKAAGVDVVSFGAGEPDFNTPAPIIEAAKAALDRGVTKYTAVGGTPELRKAIAEAYTRRYGLACAAANVAVSVGGKHALYNVAMALLRPGDRVLIPSPYWVSYPPQVELADGVPVLLPCSAKDRFLLSPEALERAIREHQPRYLILNSPSNPTGQAYAEEELRALLEVLRAHPEVFLVWDSIYERLVYGGFTHVEPAALAPDLAARIIVVSGFSKAYSMTGWRLGYTIAAKPLIDDIIKFQGHCTSNPTSFAQAGALAALSLPNDVIDEMVARFAERRERMLALLDGIPGLACAAPRGAFYAFPCVDNYFGRSFQGKRISNDLELAEYLLTEARVAVVPGSAFGAPDNIRLSYATSMQQIDEGLRRIGEALAKLA